MSVSAVVHEAARSFDIEGDLVSIERYGSGHINDSYCAAFDRGGATTRFLMQRINHRIFKQPLLLMENIHRVTTHVAEQLSDDPDSDRRVLTLIPDRDGLLCHVDREGEFWRAYKFIERAHTYDTIQSPAQAFQAAKAFGQFQRMLVTLPAPRLHETIPDFHNTPKRLEAFLRALGADPCNRAAEARDEIAYALEYQALASILTDADLPERTIHADTKINNVLLDDASGEGLCVIDLDTVMPGLSLHDFGDMVRTATSPAAEDELNLSKVRMQMPMFEALVRGYLGSTADFLSAGEKTLLVDAGKLITYEQALRFLTDFILGDPYYKIAREKHNLDRTRTQIALLKSINEQEDAMQRFVDRIAASPS
ncbi:phosphotransferase enzyme family protein [Acidicapsa dinghuensis]|uniref:Phosphotransferase enzyme family protein n=1 Tax=Acidicapsa dinghuensis TaxID=2218256 RepID=A0ABW1EHQ9_9BACT|nr:aminoglycoside phosphotransferase family protein [Acidicapsa dinghuensis]